MDTISNPENPYLTVAEARQLYMLGDAAHDFDHVLRVMQMALRLAAAEGADPTIVQLAALLHDVPIEFDDSLQENSRQAHHLVAAEFARQLLMAHEMAEANIANVVHCIEAHRFRDQSVQPQTIEAQCLYDADKLDSIGAIGVARAFAFAGAHANRLWTQAWRTVPPAAAKPTGADYTPVHEYVYKLRQIVDTLYTPTARAIGAQRHAFMEQFFEQLEVEMRQ
ncbi:MAG: HD domain-containing protein [Caldilineaceae bacterium]